MARQLVNTRDDKGKPIDVDEVVLIDWDTMNWAPSWLEPAHVYSNMQAHPVLSSIWNDVWKAMGHYNIAIALFYGWGSWAVRFTNF